MIYARKTEQQKAEGESPKTLTRPIRRPWCSRSQRSAVQTPGKAHLRSALPTPSHPHTQPPATRHLVVQFSLPWNCRGIGIAGACVVVQIQTSYDKQQPFDFHIHHGCTPHATAQRPGPRQGNSRPAHVPGANTWRLACRPRPWPWTQWPLRPPRRRSRTRPGRRGRAS